MKKINFFLVFFISCFSFFAAAQNTKKITTQQLFWVRYYNQFSINKKWSLHTELDNRMFIPELKQHQFLIRIQGRYKISTTVEAGAGFVYFLQSPQEPGSTSSLVVPELRPQQDITLKQSFSKLNLSHRYLLEERYFRNNDGKKLMDGYRFNYRFRYRLQADFLIWKKQNKELKGVVNDEILLNFGKNITANTFDQNRIYAGAQLVPSKNMAFELGYMHWFQERASGADFYNRHIIRCSIYHKLSLKK